VNLRAGLLGEGDHPLDGLPFGDHGPRVGVIDRFVSSLGLETLRVVIDDLAVFLVETQSLASLADLLHGLEYLAVVRRRDVADCRAEEDLEPERADLVDVGIRSRFSLVTTA